MYYQPELAPTLDPRLRKLRDASQVRRNQPAYQSMINRRFMIVPPALPRGGYVEKLKTRAIEFLCLLLEVANMRALQLHFVVLYHLPY